MSELYDADYLQQIYGDRFSKSVYNYFKDKPINEMNATLTDKQVEEIYKKNTSFDELSYEERAQYKFTCEKLCYFKYRQHAKDNHDDAILWINPNNREEDEKRIHGRSWDECPAFQKDAYEEAVYDLEYMIEVRRDIL